MLSRHPTIIMLLVAPIAAAVAACDQQPVALSERTVEPPMVVLRGAAAEAARRSDRLRATTRNGDVSQPVGEPRDVSGDVPSVDSIDVGLIPSPRIQWPSTQLSILPARGEFTPIQVTSRMFYMGNRWTHQVRAYKTDGTYTSPTLTLEGNSYFVWPPWSTFMREAVTETTFEIPGTCDYSIAAETAHLAWWDLLVTRIPGWAQGQPRVGATSHSGEHGLPECARTEPECSTDDGGGGQMDEARLPSPSRGSKPGQRPSAALPMLASCDHSSGSGSGGHWVTVTTCWGYHVYDDGVYQYSVVEGCTVEHFWEE